MTQRYWMDKYSFQQLDHQFRVRNEKEKPKESKDRGDKHSEKYLCANCKHETTSNIPSQRGAKRWRCE